MKKCLLAVFTLFVVFPINAQMRGAFDWKKHDSADYIVIAEISDQKITEKNNQRLINGFKTTILKIIRGEFNKNIIEVSFDPLEVVLNGNFSNDVIFQPGTYYIMYLKADLSFYKPMNIPFPFIRLPKYYENYNGNKSKEVLLFQLENALKDNDAKVVLEAIKIYQETLLLSPSLGVLKTLKGNKNQAIRQYAINELALHSDQEVIQMIEKSFLKGKEDIISEDYLLRISTRSQKPPFSIKVCNLMASASNPQTKLAGIAMLQKNADITSLPILINALDSKNQDIRFFASNALAKLTSKSKFVGYDESQNRKDEIVKFWKEWAKHEMREFLKDSRNADKTTWRDPLIVSF